MMQMTMGEVRPGDVFPGGQVVEAVEEIDRRVAFELRFPDGHVERWLYPIGMAVSVSRRVT